MLRTADSSCPRRLSSDTPRSREGRSVMEASSVSPLRLGSATTSLDSVERTPHVQANSAPASDSDRHRHLSRRLRSRLCSHSRRWRRQRFAIANHRSARNRCPRCLSEPGEQFMYSNLGMGTLGLIVEENNPEGLVVLRIRRAVVHAAPRHGVLAIPADLGRGAHSS